MKAKEAIIELKDIKKQYIGGTEECSIIAESIDMAIKALDVQNKLQEMVETLENNLSSAITCTTIDLSSEYEQAKYQAHYKCLEHLKEILR